MEQNLENNIKIENNINTDVNINLTSKPDVDIEGNINTNISIGQTCRKQSNGRDSGKCRYKEIKCNDILDYVGYIGGILFGFTAVIIMIFLMAKDIKFNEILQGLPISTKTSSVVVMVVISMVCLIGLIKLTCSNINKNIIIDLTANRYIDYIDDDLYKVVSQISNESKRYVEKLNSINESGFSLPKEYINYLIECLNEANESWYELYKDIIKEYSSCKDDKINCSEAKENGYELRKLRVEKGVFIEEVCYDIKFIDSGKKEIIYRLIESGRIHNDDKKYYDSIKEIFFSN